MISKESHCTIRYPLCSIIKTEIISEGWTQYKIKKSTKLLFKKINSIQKANLNVNIILF